MTRTTVETVTRGQLVALAIEAAEAGDLELHGLCLRALGIESTPGADERDDETLAANAARPWLVGPADLEALATCVRVITDAEAMDDDA